MNKKRTILLLSAIAVFFSLQAQTTTYGDTIFFYNFGEHTHRVECLYMPAGSYTFASENGDRNQREIQDNYYAVVDPRNIRDAITSDYSFFWTAPTLSAVTSSGSSRYYTADHTPGDINGAVMVVNAGETVNYIYKRNLTHKTGYRYLLSFWIYVVAKSSQFSMEATNTTTGKTYIYTGPLLTDEGKWIKYDLNFSVPISANMTTNEVTIGLQNRNKLITGNDYYIDDILVSTLHTDPLTIDVSNTGPVCEGSPIQLIVNSGGDALPFTYAWTGPNGFTSAESSPILSNSTANMSGIYNVTVTDALGQVATATTNVIVNTVPKSDFSVSGNTIDNKNNIVTFSITPEDGVEYEWDLGDGTKEKGSTFTHTYSIDGNTYEYKIQLKSTISQGCSSTTSKTIEVTPFVPNVFSPNGDGVNDHFMTGFDTQIFDRSGNLLFSGTSGWDGNYHGREMDNDTYFYQIKYTDKYLEVSNLKGFVILKR